MIFPSILPEGDVHQFSFDWYNCWFNSIEYLHGFVVVVIPSERHANCIHMENELYWGFLERAGVCFESSDLLHSFDDILFRNSRVSLYIIEYECLANRFFAFHRYSPFNRKGEVNTNWNWKSFFVSRKKGNNKKLIAFSVWHFSLGIYKDELSRNQEN